MFHPDSRILGAIGYLWFDIAVLFACFAAAGHGIGGTVATAATLAYHAISLWLPAVWSTIAFIVLQKTKKQPIILRNPPERLRAGRG